jgi:hypothetical protein
LSDGESFGSVVRAEEAEVDKRLVALKKYYQDNDLEWRW